jgi:Mrp family chromosome partitioning ATPase
LRASVATVLTSHRWEEEFVSFVRDGAGFRVVTRAYEPEELTRSSADVIVIGSETSWISPVHVRTWRRRGIRVVGVHPPGDEPGRQLLERGGADTILPETTSVVGLFRAVQALSIVDAPPTSEGTIVSVTGPRGAPGRTEIALAFALDASTRQRTLLVDLDPPSLGVRLGLSPTPSLSEALEITRMDGMSPPVRRMGALSILTGVEGGPLAASLRWELIRSALDTFDLVVADLGPWPHNSGVLRNSGEALIVCDPGPTGMVRAATMVSDWHGPTPLPILNRADPTDETLRMARRALGLEPAAVVPFLESVRAASHHCAPPPAELIRALSSLRIEEARV